MKGEKATPSKSSTCSGRPHELLGLRPALPNAWRCTTLGLAGITTYAPRIRTKRAIPGRGQHLAVRARAR
jgi:hypothetical protein